MQENTTPESPVDENVESFIYTSGWPQSVDEVIEKSERGTLNEDYINQVAERFVRSVDTQVKADPLQTELNNASAVMSTLDKLRAQGAFSNYGGKGKKK